MTIGFDIDGVILDQERFQINKGIKHFKKIYAKEYLKKTGKKISLKDIQVVDKNKGPISKNKVFDYNEPYITIDSTGYSLKDVFGCSSEEETKFWKKNMLSYALFSPIRFRGKEIINKLKKDGNNIYFITARAKANEDNFIGKVQRFLVKFKFSINGVKYDDVKFCSYKKGIVEKEKTDLCNELGIDVMIEDNKETAKFIADNSIKTRPLLFLTKNNQSLTDDEIPRHVNFDEVFVTIKSLEEDKFKVLNRKEKQELSENERKEYYTSYRNHLKGSYFDNELAKKDEKKLAKNIKLYKGLFNMLVPNKAINLNKLTDKAGVIYTLNHRSLIDIPLLMRWAKRKDIHAIVKSEFLSTPLAKPLTKLGCKFVDRKDKSSRKNIRKTAAVLISNAKSIVVCPEGTRNKTKNDLLDFDYGAVSIAQTTGAPIQPCAIVDVGKKRVINFGELIRVGENDDLEVKNRELYSSTLKLIEEVRGSSLVKQKTFKKF